MSNNNLNTTEIQEKYSIYRDKGFGFITALPNSDFIKSLEEFHFKKLINHKESSSRDAKISLPNELVNCSKLESGYPVIFEPVINLFIKFLEYKCQYGSSVEKEIYGNMPVEDLIGRLLEKLLDPNKILEFTTKTVHTIGTGEESPLFTMKDYLTLDEHKLASFISISLHFQNEIKIGISTPILDRKGLFDYQDIVVTKTQNTKQNGYGIKPKEFKDLKLESTYYWRQIWCKFYQCRSLIFKHFDLNQKRKFSTTNRFIADQKKTSFYDCNVLSKRYSIMIDTILLDSEARAQEIQKYANIIISRRDLQMTNIPMWHEKVFMETFDIRLLVLCWTTLFHIKSITFIGFNEEGFLKNNGDVKVEVMEYSSLYNKHPLGGIKIYFSDKNEEGTSTINDDEIIVQIYERNKFLKRIPWIRKDSLISKLKIATTHFGVVTLEDFIGHKRKILEENLELHKHI